MTRKDFFRLGLLKAATAAAGVVAGVEAATSRAMKARPEVLAPDFVRPPGALPEAEFLAACTRCDECVKACPHWVVRKAGPELGRRIEATPILIPAENPCLFCDGLPCIAACLPGALVRPPEGDLVAIGVAVVDPDICYMAMNQPCDYCMGDCPTRPKAIQALLPGSAATVHEDLCTGCGKCAQICPPSAIRILPREAS